ncbi:MAG: esterase [Gemmatimonadota bacterium]|nr:esterase [Gemmatimonadota bacterium]
MPQIRTARLTVPRTARYAAFGPPPAQADELWIVLHGYGQLADEFLAQCAALDNGRRCVVAPEALSRFYQPQPGSATAERRVGASWMTREERDTEIGDYLRYLDLVLETITEGAPVPPPLHVLGFSQGTATASRWAASGRVRPARLVCWGGMIAPELDIESADAPLRQVRLQLVIGSRDKYATPERVADEQANLEAAGLRYELVTFEGGHWLDDATLVAIAEGWRRD